MSLEHRLRNAPVVRRELCKLLEDLSDSAKGATEIASGRRPNRVSSLNIDDLDPADYGISSSDSDSDASSTTSLQSTGVSEIEQLIAALKVSLDGLFKASVLINRSSPRKRRQRARSTKPFTNDIDALFIRDAFPFLGHRDDAQADALIARLSEANARRRQYFKYCRDHNTRLAHKESERPGVIAEPVPEAAIAEAAIVLEKSLAPTNALSTLLAQTEATNLDFDPMTSVAFEQGGLEPAMSVTSFATSVVEGDEEELHFPSLPPEARDNASFICDFCKTAIVLKPGDKVKRWHEHVLADLEPYICTFTGCGLETFASRHAWFQHELLQHRLRWVCPLCQALAASREELQRHVQAAHEFDVVPSHITGILDEGRQAAQEVDPASCPFCDDDWAVANPILEGDEAETIVVSTDQFQQHVGHHLRRIALFALPRLSIPEEQDETLDVKSLDAHPDGAPMEEMIQQLDKSEGSWEDVSDGESGAHSIDSSGSIADAQGTHMTLHLRPESVESPGCRCFFAVIHPKHTESLQATKFRSCLSPFTGPRSLLMHFWHTHSLSFNCPWCRDSTTQASKEFQKKHALCASRADIKQREPMPVLFTTEQEEAFQRLNRYLKRLKYDKLTYRALWKALFPNIVLDNGIWAKLSFADAHGLVRGHRVQVPSTYEAHAASPEDLVAASAEGHIHAVQHLLINRANVDLQDETRGNALLAASQNGFPDIVELLLNNGADVNSRSGKYGSALQAASHRGYAEIVQLLLQRGANVDLQGGDFGSALQAAASEGFIDIVRLLLLHGARPNILGGWYGNALQAAATEGYGEIVGLLLSQGANVNVIGETGSSALYRASWGGYTDIVELLLKRGADVNAQGGDFGNPLQAAAAAGCQDIVRLLLRKGANINAQGGMFGTAIRAAAQTGHRDIFNMLKVRGAEW